MCLGFVRIDFGNIVVASIKLEVSLTLAMLLWIFWFQNQNLHGLHVLAALASLVEATIWLTASLADAARLLLML